ncbi:hypothetical protein [Nocardiopsis sp. FIRDI 009]|uniref:hypothetical protein n=1 Tax=Nocardiopsis sp. FIRDI 009 TaxID=714197 RepID=UPI000E268499|nr:hypothetical protein [Nocardiopsis sp. FIRDI 009]
MDTTELTHLIDRLRDIPDPVERTRTAAALIDALKDAQTRVKAVRADAAAELRQGRTLRQVGELLGVSPARVDQILRGK